MYWTVGKNTPDGWLYQVYRDRGTIWYYTTYVVTDPTHVQVIVHGAKFKKDFHKVHTTSHVQAMREVYLGALHVALLSYRITELEYRTHIEAFAVTCRKMGLHK